MSKASFDIFRGKLMGAKKFIALKAFSLAEKAHAGVTRKDGVTPYIEHPVKVAAMLFELGIQDDTILAVALLHDVIEDCEDEEIKRKVTTDFPKEVSEAVMVLSKPKGYNNTMYYQNISLNPIATLVKLADRTHNLSTLFNFTEVKKAKYLKETIEFIYPLVKYAQHNYYEYANQLRMFDLWIEALVKNIEPYIKYVDGEQN